MQTTVKWTDGVAFVGTAASGHSVTMDGAPEHGGRNLGFRPMEMLLLGLGGCSSFDLIDILKKGRQSVSGCEVQIDAQRSDEVPAVFTDITLHFKITGTNLKRSVVDRAVSLSAEKYCSASIMLARGGVNVHHSYELVDASEAPTE